jgi:hypothetical protein
MYILEDTKKQEKTKKDNFEYSKCNEDNKQNRVKGECRR